jgi:tripeptide aminopeptidase
MAKITFDEKQAIDRLLRFLAVSAPTGHEQAIGREVLAALVGVHVPRNAIHFDDANQRIPLATETGNLIVTLPGTRPGPRRLFACHLDTVPLAAGATPKRRDGRIVAASDTALGGDNRTGVACLVTLAAALHEQGLPHSPLTLLFTVREESGLWGARYVDRAELGNPVEGYNVDGRSPYELTVGAVGAERWEVEIFGRAAHAGVHPEQGVSATLVASLALTEAHEGGWFGKVRQNGREGTSNIGVFGGKPGHSAGDATNVVTDYVRIHGESRSHSLAFVKEITAAYRSAFRAAAGRVKNDKGRGAKVRFETRRDYFPFRLSDKAPVVRHSLAAAANAGMPLKLRVTNGGLDANWLTRNGIPTVTFGAGQNNIHAIGEYVEIADYLAACRLAIALATLET